jgi:hypothetical protein
MQKIQQKLVLLLGCTGPTGYHIANKILKDKQFSLRVVVRSRAKLQKLFKEK